MQPILQADSLKQLYCSGFGRWLTRFESCEQRQQNIFLDVQLWQQSVFLKNKTDMLISKTGELTFGQTPGILAKDFHDSGCRGSERPCQ
jgi:hypothetical protein